MTTRIDLSIDAPIATATIRTESGLNVISLELLDTLAKHAARVAEDHKVRVFIIKAEGKVFVAGANIVELSKLVPSSAATLADKGRRTFDAIANLPCATIARIHGSALGGGLELALACDFRVAVQGAKLGMPETSLGLIPGWQGISRLRALSGLAVTRRLVFTAAMVDATEAHQLGFVDHVSKTDADLDKHINELIEQLLKVSPNGIAMAKKALNTSDEIGAFTDCFSHPDAKEGMAAFIEKRKPTWSCE